MIKHLLFLFFISINTFGQLSVSPSSVLNNSQLFEILKESVLTDDSNYMITNSFDKYLLYNSKTKESFYIDKDDSLVDEYVCYIKISFNDMINKDVSLDRKTLMGSREKFIIYGINKCYCIYGELVGDTYRLVYTWDCN